LTLLEKLLHVGADHAYGLKRNFFSVGFSYDKISSPLKKILISLSALSELSEAWIILHVVTSA